MDEDGPAALLDAEAGLPVIMRGASAQGVMAVPLAAETFDNIQGFRCRVVRHGIFSSNYALPFPRFPQKLLQRGTAAKPA